MHLIVALNNNNVIGNDNTIPWHLPSDLKRFKALTENNIVVMGRKTYDSLPKKPLKNRINVVITTNPKPFSNDDTLFFVNLENSIELLNHINLLNRFKNQKQKEIYIIGGSSIYKYFFDYCTHYHITKVYNDISGNVLFPYNLELFKNQKKYTLTNTPKNMNENNIEFSYFDYQINVMS